MRIAVRVFVVVMVAAAVLTMVLAARGMYSRTGASFGLAVAVPGATLPGVIAWWRPGARTLALWLALAAVFGAAYWIAGWPASSQLTEAGGPAVIAMLRIDGLLVFVAMPVLLFAVATAGRSHPAVDSPRTHRVRIIVRIAFAIALVSGAIGMLPGEQLYREVSGCDQLAAADCAPIFSGLIRERPAGGIALVLFLVVMLAPGLLVRADPRPGPAVLWALWTIPSAVVAGVATFHLDLFWHVVKLWPRLVVELGVGTLLVLVIVVLPMVAFTSRPAAGIPEARLRR